MQVESGRSEPSIKELARFYFPLATTAMLMMVTHSVVSGAVARTPEPAIALAAYSAASSVGQVFESPCYRMQQMAIIFIQGKQSFRTVCRAALHMLAFFALCIALIGWTPLSRVVLQGILGTPERVYPGAVASLRVLILWPVFSTLRALYQSLIVRQKRTIWMTVNMVLRVTAMLGLAVILPRVWTTGPVGAVILMTGLGTEAVLALVVSRRALPPLEPDPADLPVVSERHVLRFFLPLALAASVHTLGRPALTAALARTARPEVALSGYHVAFSFAMIFAVPIHAIYHMVLVYVKDPASCRRVRRFAMTLGASASVLLALTGLPGPGMWIFGVVIGVPADIAREALRTLSLLALLPLLFANMEFYADILMLTRRTVPVTAAKLTNILVMSVLAITLTRLYPELGAAAGAVALVAGSTVEAAAVYGLVRLFPDSRAYLRPGATVTIPA